MLTLNDAKQIVHLSSCAVPRDKALVLLAIAPSSGLKIAELKKRALLCGWRAGAKMNLSGVLTRGQGLALRAVSGWELTAAGKEHVAGLSLALPGTSVIRNTSHSLRQHLSGIADPLTKAFVEEAIACFEALQFRAAVVFSWAGAVALLHKRVFDKHLIEFNVEATRREPKWRQAKQQDDLGRMKERDFLDVCEAIGILGKSVKQTLQNDCLGLRNGCGHPNSLAISEHSVAAHVEKLMLNVFSRF